MKQKGKVADFTLQDKHNIIRVASLSPKRRKQGLSIKFVLPAIVNMGILCKVNVFL